MKLIKQGKYLRVTMLSSELEREISNSGFLWVVALRIAGEEE